MTHEISQIGKDNYPIILLMGNKCKKKEKKKHTKLRRTRYWLPEGKQEVGRVIRSEGQLYRGTWKGNFLEANSLMLKRLKLVCMPL